MLKLLEVNIKYPIFQTKYTISKTSTHSCIAISRKHGKDRRGHLTDTKSRGLDALGRKCSYWPVPSLPFSPLLFPSFFSYFLARVSKSRASCAVFTRLRIFYPANSCKGESQRVITRLKSIAVPDFSLFCYPKPRDTQLHAAFIAIP